VIFDLDRVESDNCFTHLKQIKGRIRFSEDYKQLFIKCDLLTQNQDKVGKIKI